MTLRRVLRSVLFVALAANALLVVDALTLGVLVPRVVAGDQQPDGSARDGGSDPEELHPLDRGPEVEAETYRTLVQELEEQRKVLEEKARQLVERERELTAARKELDAEREEIARLRDEAKKERERLEALRSPSFDRLLKAYEGMDPANAASALVELYRKNRRVVVDLLLGMKPRQAAGTLDSLASTHPKIAAELSWEIWQKDPRRQK